MKIAPDGNRLYKAFERQLCFGRHLSVVLCRQYFSKYIYGNLELIPWKIKRNHSLISRGVAREYYCNCVMWLGRSCYGIFFLTDILEYDIWVVVNFPAMWPLTTAHCSLPVDAAWRHQRRCEQLTTVCPPCVQRSAAVCLRPCRTAQPQPPQNTVSLLLEGPTDSAWSPCLYTRNCRVRTVKEVTGCCRCLNRTWPTLLANTC
jgi:hypothetical protein